MVPATASELEKYTPASLKNVPVPPVFLLRPADGREQREWEYRLAERGLCTHGPEAIRAEMLRGLESRYDAETFAASKARLESFWALCDQGGTVDPRERADVDELTQRLYRVWQPIQRMFADNYKFGEESGRIAAAMFIVGWRKFDLPYRREEGAVPLEVIDDVELALIKIEQDAAANKVEGVAKPGTAFGELKVAAFLKIFLTRDEEKNLSSPPPSKPGPNGLTKRPSKRTGAAKSKASASSKSQTA